jgi:hypothetical protein
MVRNGYRILCLAALLASHSVHAQDIIFWSDFETDACPAGRILASPVLYYTAQGWPTAIADMTEWENIWGRGAPGAPIEPWPGQRYVSVVIQKFLRTGYIAAHFTVPNDGVTYTGVLNHATYYSGADLTTAVSRGCGDFEHVEPRCYREAGAGEAMARWRNTASSGQCTLEPGDYYLNIKLTDPGQLVSGCDLILCEENIQSNWDGS